MNQPVQPRNPFGNSCNWSQNVPVSPEQPPPYTPGGWYQQPQMPTIAGLNEVSAEKGCSWPPCSHHSQPGSQQSQTAVTAAPQLGAPFSEDYHLVVVAKRTMVLLSPDRNQTLFTVDYPKSDDGPSLTVKRGGSDGPQIGHATVHYFTTSKVDVEVNGGKLRFKKEFKSTTGQGQLTWSFDSGSLFLEDDGERLLARFAPRDGDVKDKNRHEGRLEIKRQGLNAAQFEEVIITCLAELERRRNDAEWDDAFKTILSD